jgi:Kef-type K+ transport system membrane component KefB
MSLDISTLNISALTIIGIAVITGFYLGRAAKLINLPAIIGYMLLGVILGPSLLNLITEKGMEDLNFITNIALGLVAFSIGSELNLSSLKHLGWGIISIILSESLIAFGVVTAVLYLVTGDLPLSLVFGAMAPASAPAGTVAVIQENRAKGNLTKALYAVVGFDDGFAIVIFGFTAALVKYLLVSEATGENAHIMASLLHPFKEIGLSILVGTIMGFLFCQFVRKLKHPPDMFALVFGTVILTCGLAARWNLSLILTNMIVGFVLVNTRRESLVHRVVNPTLNFMPLVFILFFCLAGAHLQLLALPSLGLIGIVYTIGRICGLIGGAEIGGIIGKVEKKIRKYIGLGILSQAGVAIGLSLIIKSQLSALDAEYDIPHASEIGTVVLTTITATCIIFEIIGPICTKIALSKAGEIPSKNRNELK